jgi:hypothetical protein
MFCGDGPIDADSIEGGECKTDDDCTKIECFAPPCDPMICVDNHCVVKESKPIPLSKTLSR